MAPSVPAGPCGPMAPSAPAGPAGPCGPIAPSSPGGPAGPCGPVSPSVPAGPCSPAGPPDRPGLAALVSLDRTDPLDRSRPYGSLIALCACRPDLTSTVPRDPTLRRAAGSRAGDESEHAGCGRVTAAVDAEHVRDHRPGLLPAAARRAREHDQRCKCGDQEDAGRGSCHVEAEEREPVPMTRVPLDRGKYTPARPW